MLNLYAMNDRTKLNLGAFILGLSSMVGQIIIIRELIVIFYGNELSLSVILASWLFWTSLGSSLFGRFIDTLKSKEKLLSYIQLSTSLALPLNILFIRNIKSVLNVSPGELIGFMPMLGSSFLSLSILCMLLGFSFVLISKIAAEKEKDQSFAVGRIYLLEGLGASIGGVAYSFFLIKLLAPFENAFIIAAFSLFASLLFNKNIFQIIYLTVLSIAFLLNWPSRMEGSTRKAQFRPFELIETTDSIYGNITVTRTGKEFSFYENGLLLFTSGDLLTSEESSHYAMLQHRAPKNILLIGGGMGGSLKEILKHPVKNVDYVELDPLIIKLSAKYLAPINDKRVNVINADGREFVKKSSPDKKYDVIILNLPDPYTAMLNRFYSVEFFKEVKEILAPDGIFSFALTSSENYINPEQAYYLASIYNTLKHEFSEIKIFPGDSAIFFATDKSGALTYDAATLIGRLKDRRINTSFVREYYLPFKLSPMRIKYIEDSIKEYGAAKINKDFKPIGYLYHASLWMTIFHGGKGILPYLEKINLSLFTKIAILLFLLAFLIQKLKKSPFKTPVALSIATTGMSEMSFQIIVILAFQFLYGYVYYKIGIILTSFMIGLVLGSFFITRHLGHAKDKKSLYLKTQVAICLYPLILPLVFTYIAKRPEIAGGMELSFAMLPIIAGFIGGVQFPLANKICLEASGDVGKTTGFLYGLDLFGASIGGILVGLLLVPVIGIVGTCVLLCIINTLVLILLSAARAPH